MKKLNKDSVKWVLALIVALGVLLRFWQINTNPPGLTWDEAALGYNAYSILETGRDEYGTFLPVSIRSFDDYKPSAYVYLSIPFVWAFGLNEFSVRFLSALCGSLTVLVVFFLVKEVLYLKDKTGKSYLSAKAENPVGIVYLLQLFSHKHASVVLALLAAFFVSISPWHIQHSRAAFEGNVGLFFFSLGILFLYKALKNKWYYLLSSLSMVVGMYSYHSFRLTIPLVGLVFFVLFFKQIWKNKLIVVLSAIIFLTLTSPIAYDVLSDTDGTGSRLSLVTRFGDPEYLTPSIERIEIDRAREDHIGALFHHRYVEQVRFAAQGYLDHYDPEFLFLLGDWGKHHHASEMGVLYVWEVIFILIGFATLLFYTNKRIGLLFAWMVAAPVAASITTGTPHAVRAIAMLIPFHILTAVGVYYIAVVVLSQKKKIISYTILGSIIGLFLINFYYYLHQYFVHTPIEYSDFWQSTNRELYRDLKELEDDYDTIIVTYFYDQPYIYYLFFNKIDPLWYQSFWQTEGKGVAGRTRRIIGKYDFKKIEWSSEKERQNALIVVSGEETIDDLAPIKTYTFENGMPAYVLYEVNVSN